MWWWVGEGLTSDRLPLQKLVKTLNETLEGGPRNFHACEEVDNVDPKVVELLLEDPLEEDAQGLSAQDEIRKFLC